MASKDIVTRIQNAPQSSQRLKRQNFDLSTGAAGARTKIASYQAESPLALRETDIRLMFITVDEFQTPGDGSTTTYNLNHNLLPTSNTQDFVLYEGGSRVAADSVDYAGDSFDYTGPGSQEYLHAFYVARNPVQIEIEKSAPRSQGQVSEVVYDDVTSILHERNQHKEPPALDFRDKGALAPMVPRKWTLDIYADGPVPFAWDDSGESNSQGTTATNAVVSIPVNRSKTDIQGLGQAVKEDIIS